MKYKCGVCGYIYDEEKEGVKFADLPEDWICPVCGETKDGFSPVEEDDEPAPVRTEVKAVSYEKEDLKQLTPGQLSAVCSNLARACQKQQLAEESELFMKIADYYSANSVAPDHEGVASLMQMVNADIESYPAAKKTATLIADRGTLRVLTWNEKVTMILRTLLERYQKDPHFLDNTNVYVCDICGFIYIGDEPPEICPVCKVPGFMFIQIMRKV